MPSLVAKADILSLRLSLEGVGDFEVAAFNSSWGLGQMPSASCALAIGRNARNPNLAAAIHNKGGKLTQMHPAKVYLKMRGAYGLGTTWPEDETVIFDGYLTGIGHTKSMGVVSFVAHLIHWASDLAFSSALSEQSHPANPSDYTFPAVGKTWSPTGAKSNRGIGFLDERLIKASTVASDLWGDCIKPFFCLLSQQDHVKTTGDAAGIGQADQKNDQALAALSRFEGGTGDCGRKLSKYGVKLSMDSAGSTALETVARSISDAIGRDSVEAYLHNTLWDTLVGSLGPRFMFSVVPLVDSALVVPVIAGLRSTYAQQIASNDYEYLDLTGYIPRPIRGVGIYGSKETVAGTRDPNGPANVTSRLGLGGYYEPKNASKRGLILIRRAPPWLANIATTGSSPARTTGLKGKLVVSSSTTPQAERQGEIVGDAAGRTQGERATEAGKLYNAYAQAMYAAETLRGRNGMLAGKLRFDIAPGSNVFIAGSTEQFIGSSDLLGQNLVGTVLRVSIGINAQAGRAGTGFQLGNLRTETENTKDETSIKQHPLYKTKFLGAPLVPYYVV